MTLGCSHGSCAFCGAYQGKPFALKDPAVIARDIAFAARHMSRQRRLFLCDGDALSAPRDFLARILAAVRRELPRVTRVGSYANARGLAGKTLDDLRALRELGLSHVHMGLETGDDALLAAMGKGVGLDAILAQAAKVKEAGMRLCVTVITGLGGTTGWQRHARLTGEALTAMQPDQAAALSLIPVPGTVLWEAIRAGRFLLPDALGLVRELRELLEHTRLERGLFLADHASNHVPLKLRMPRDKAAGLALLDAALAGARPLKPERARRL